MPDIRAAVEQFLLRCGFSPSLAGFNALRVAIEVVSKEPNRLRNIHKLVYPLVAHETGYKGSTTRQYMYRSFYSFLDHADLDKVQQELGYAPPASKGVYTLKEFLAAAAIVVRKEG